MCLHSKKISNSVIIDNHSDALLLLFSVFHRCLLRVAGGVFQESCSQRTLSDPDVRSNCTSLLSAERGISDGGAHYRLRRRYHGLVSSRAYVAEPQQRDRAT